MLVFDYCSLVRMSNILYCSVRAESAAWLCIHGLTRPALTRRDAAGHGVFNSQIINHILKDSWPNPLQS